MIKKITISDLIRMGDEKEREWFMFHAEVERIFNDTEIVGIKYQATITYVIGELDEDVLNTVFESNWNKTAEVLKKHEIEVEDIKIDKNEKKVEIKLKTSGIVYREGLFEFEDIKELLKDVLARKIEEAWISVLQEHGYI
ncbi:hypothetical protein PFDSM3638_06520 [Pyrococcus furiosus DSM 3638]|uniref:Uncharacterized protein n=3 Tax=Pyrococcus furiosus TaxID=2261 RepID=A0A5C0XNZ1_PYRFU|nr:MULTISPECIES: hypothetical protein [Pyrococcus]AAL81431.1 hypothetical protein PF1307 [Pyrococcus furiosus DSM 3638]AFN04091.1 hypothetical protein PFC_05750 [Pyrococcus furiosus COM1]MDK2870193.1 hypothetical protein [Pyrococcus sp.]QEK78946.1 hypothetical protein PFDSM3638_06520 [Pyrococcus furiosus DSM 3638]